MARKWRFRADILLGIARAKMDIFKSSLVAKIGGFLVFLISCSVWSQVVTYNGTYGIGNTIVNDANNGCARCHSASWDVADWTASALISSYSTLTSGTTETDAQDRINGTGGYMPPSGYEGNGVSSPLSSALRTRYNNWISSGALLNAAPYVQTPGFSSVGKYGFTMSSLVNENGSNTTFQFYYRVSGVGSYVSAGTFSPSGSGGSGASSSVSVQDTISSGLACETTYQVYIRGSNSAGATNSSSATQTTDDCNDPPVITSSAVTTATEEVAYTYDVNATDPSDFFTFSLTTSPTGMTINQFTGLIEWTPTNAQALAGTANVTVSVADGGEDGASPDTQSFVINITEINDPPSITTTATTLATEDIQYSYDADASDDDDTDNGGGLVWSLTNEPTGMLVSQTGVVTWTPQNGDTTSGLVTLSVTDGQYTDMENFTISVSATNDAPEITSTAPVGATVLEDNLFTYDITTQDIDGDDVTLSIGSGASGDMQIVGSQLRWTPLEGETSTTVTIVASDTLLEDRQTFDITVTPVNDAPVINTTILPMGVETLEYTANLSITDDDHDISEIALSLDSAPAGMIIEEVGALRRLVWTPPEGTRDTGNFRLIADDGEADPVVQILSVEVVEYNTPPAITSTAGIAAIEDIEYQYTVVVDDLDDPNPSVDLTFELSNQPEGMAVDADGVITWTPLEGVLTSGTVTITVTDGQEVFGSEDPAAPAVENFTITVTSVNDAPVITSTAPSAVTELNDYSYQVNVDDPDDDNDGSGALTFNLSNAPSGMTISNTGLIEWTPPEGEPTTGEITISVTDGGEDAATPGTELVTIEVIEFNTPPLITSTAGTVATEDVQYQYQLVIDDIDDPNDGSGALTFELSDQPTGMSVSNTGLITWTPLEGITTSGEVTITVTDGQEVFADEDPAAPAVESFTIAVNRVNDAPTILSSPITQVAEDTEYRYQVAVTDPDDENNGSDFSFALSGEPDGMTISNTGLITWQTDENSPLNSNITITVVDGLEDGVQPVEQSFTLTVNFDIDGDGIANDLDNCRDDANADQADNDLDGQGDVCDEDDDNDSITDEFETENGLDPLDPSDAELDSDGDGETNAEEFANGSNPNVDDVPPSITAPLNILRFSTGFETFIDLGSAVATDSLNGPLSTTANRESGPFRTGRHVVTWTAMDELGNASSTEQVVDVIPQISIASSQSVEEGQAASVTVRLNGDPVRYPVTVDYSVEGPNHDLEDGTLTLNETSATLEFNVLADAVPDENEEILITLSNPQNAVLSNKNVHTVSIIDSGNVAPIVELSVLQSSVPGLFVTQTGGLVVVDSVITDPNASETFSYAWTASDNAIVSDVGNAQSRFIFDPAGLSDGMYRFSLTVTDSADAEVSESVLIRISSSSVADVNANGIDDSIDISTESFILQTENGASEQFIETENGLRLVLGDTALRSQTAGSLISLETLQNFGNDGVGAEIANVEFPGGLFDFAVTGLSQQGQSVTIVLPQLSAIPENAIYRKYINSGWQDFVEDANNTIASASSDQGVCPAPGADDYESGLNEGDDCVQLTIEDGGPNDADGVANGTVKDPGGVTISSVSSGGSSSGGSSGGGSASPWLFLCLLLLIFQSLLPRKKIIF